jgi:hypothetical protein
MMRASLGLVVILFGACGGDDGGTTHHDAAVDTGAHADAPTDGKVFLDGPPGTAPLTVKNYLSWCSVKVNGAATGSTAGVITTNVMPGTITLVANPASSAFEIDGNIWHHTDGDAGSGEPGTITKDASDMTDQRLWSSTAMVTVGSSAKCVFVCCPFYPAGNGCDVADQCP